MVSLRDGLNYWEGIFHEANDKRKSAKFRNSNCKSL